MSDPDHSNDSNEPRDPNAVRMAGVSVRRGDVHILEGVEWTVPRGSSVAVLGPNGSGKTTLMRTITGFMWPTTGTVDVLGRRLGRTDVRELRRYIGVVDPSERFGVDEDLTTLDAVLTGYFATLNLYDEATAEQRAHAEHLLDTVGLSHRRTQRIRVLSTGEKRRALLARALVRLPELLILDEPTAGLDVSGRERVLATIEQLRAMHPELTVFMITHHVEEISPSTDQVLLLRRGRVAAVGRPDHVITPETLSDVLGCKVYVQKRAGRFWLEVLPEAWLDLADPNAT
ncbi:MAG: ATP-binding cassette domain-containing protein [Phycisphaera sp.]|nr:ATP-binding cassette domain-containing protein [Phycisphaera sp.]